VNRAWHDAPVEAVLDFLPDGAPIRVLAEPDDGEQDCLFKPTEHISHG
jgi:hypothetical protein